jgi:anti-anti-sigma factor
MPDNALTAAVRQSNEAALIDLKGEIDAFGEAALNAAYAEASALLPKTIILNFAAVDYINSTGIALIVALLAQARKGGQKLHTIGLSSHYVEIFQITRLSDFMNIYPDEASALADVKENAK